MKKYKKALTFSYDDGVRQDVRLVKLFEKYGMKATFNINSALLGKAGMLVRNGVEVRHDKIDPAEVASLYAGHEVAVHTLTHPDLTALDEAAIVREVEEDRLALSALVGYDVVGMAYPGGTHDERVAGILRDRTGVRYSRTVTSTHAFGAQSNLLRFDPSVYHLEFEQMTALDREFLALEPEQPAVFYVWGHSYEFDAWQCWDAFEAFLREMAGHDDILYATNRDLLLSDDWKAL